MWFEPTDAVSQLRAGLQHVNRHALSNVRLRLSSAEQAIVVRRRTGDHRGSRQGRPRRRPTLTPATRAFSRRAPGGCDTGENQYQVNLTLEGVFTVMTGKAGDKVKLEREINALTAKLNDLKLDEEQARIKAGATNLTALRIEVAYAGRSFNRTACSPAGALRTSTST